MLDLASRSNKLPESAKQGGTIQDHTPPILGLSALLALILPLMISLGGRITGPSLDRDTLMDTFLVEWDRALEGAHSLFSPLYYSTHPCTHLYGVIGRISYVRSTGISLRSTTAKGYMSVPGTLYDSCVRQMGDPRIWRSHCSVYIDSCVYLGSWSITP